MTVELEDDFSIGGGAFSVSPSEESASDKVSASLSSLLMESVFSEIEITCQ